MVIMEADLSMELREWYLRATKQFDWSKTELVASIATNAHEVIVLIVGENTQNMEGEDEVAECAIIKSFTWYKMVLHVICLARLRWLLKEDGRRRRNNYAMLMYPWKSEGPM